MNGVERIAAERKRQTEKESWTAKHDDQWDDGELAKAAACYAMTEVTRKLPIGNIKVSVREMLWPFGWVYWKPTPDNRIRELEKAGALIAAEIDRLLRTEGQNG